MTQKTVRVSLEMSEEELAELQRLAKKYSCIPSTRHAPSWRTLVRAIGRGSFALTPYSAQTQSGGPARPD